MNSLLRRRLVGVAVSLALVAGVVASLLYHTQKNGAPDIPPEALLRMQSLPLKDIGGADRSLADWKGKTLVVNFWATWCPPCRQEMPAFSRLHTKLADRGVVFVGIGIDSPSAIKEFALQYPVSYPLLIGGTEGLELLKTVGNPKGALPYTLVIDPNGEPLLSRLGMIEESSFEERLLSLLVPTPR